MAEPTPPQSVAPPACAGCWHRALGRLASLALILQLALGLRILAADAVDLYVHHKKSQGLCIFPDANIYWVLARTIRAGTNFEYVEWRDIPHFALRTPGYPLFLAGCQALFGERTLAVRLVQAVLGTAGVYLVYRLTRQLVMSEVPPSEPGVSPTAGATSAPHGWTVPLVATAIAAVNPYYLVMSSLILSEAVFVPLLLATLWGLAVLWDAPGRPNAMAGSRALTVALASGGAAGLAILVRPSWALFVPAVLVIWGITKLRDRSGVVAAARGAAVFALGLAVVMSPWWIRNMRVYGRFVPTALWMGASLYDGLNPRATGASNMDEFLADPQIWPLDEQDQDAELMWRAAAFVRDQPGEVLRLAWVKLLRYWSPWPNAGGFRSAILALASTVVEVPLFGLLTLGCWDRRRDPRSLVLLAGPVLYFCMLHLVFASSVRYRIPGEMPAMGLAAIGWMKVRCPLSVVRCPLSVVRCR